MAQEIDINLNVNAENADKSLGSLKRQLREAQQDVQGLSDKFGATSREAVEAAKRAADLRDRIGDAKSLTEAFNPDAKFKALSSSLSGVAGGFAAYQGAMGLAGVESKNLENQLLKVQSAMAIATGLQQLGEARDSFRQLKAVAVDAFNGIKTAIGATGIGLLVVALGTIYAYWDDIKEAVSGVSQEQKKLNADAQKNVDLQNEKLQSLGDQDNILRLQGKSEKEILKMKIAETDEAINLQNVLIATQIESNKQAVESTKKHKGMLQSMLDFINKPLEFLWRYSSKFINATLEILNKIPGVKIDVGLNEDMLKDFNKKANELTSNYVFDEKETKAEGDKVLKAQQDALKKLEDRRAASQLAINDIDKKAAKDAILTDEEKFKKFKENTDKYNKSLAEQNDTFDLTDLQNKQDELNADAKFKEDKLLAEEAFQLKYAELLYNSQHEREKREEEERQRKIQAFQDTTDAVGSIAQSGEELLSAIQSTGLARGKAGQAAMKALALVQIGADSAIAFSKMMQGTETSATGAATGVPPPAAPATYLATKIAFYASGSATILANLARAKALLSGGGGGGAGATAGGGGAVPAAAPSFNVVGPSGANQIAESIGARESQPMRAFVVGGDVTTQQGLNRGIVQNATLG
jgi:hypothetical protein